MQITVEDAITEMRVREIVFHLDPDTYPEKMAGYLTALYDLGFLSLDRVLEYEREYGVLVFPNL